MQKKVLKDWIESLLEASIIAVILYFLFWPIIIDGSSMENTFSTGDRVLFSRVLAYAGNINRGDIVICKLNYHNSIKTAIKRIIALPNDHLVIKDNLIYINGEKISEPYLKSDITKGNIDIILEEDEYFVLGDNREISLDSRKVGAISSDDIEGRVILRCYPFTKIKLY